MEFKQLIERAKTIRTKYAELEKTKYGREWTGEELMLGYVKDVGDLAKLIQAKEGVRDGKNVDEEFAHELSDCLWSIIVIADTYNVNLEAAFTKTMSDLEARLS